MSNTNEIKTNDVQTVPMVQGTEADVPVDGYVEEAKKEATQEPEKKEEVKPEVTPATPVVI